MRALSEVKQQQQSLTEKEYEDKYRMAFYRVDTKSRRITKHAVAIVDPALGIEWWK